MSIILLDRPFGNAEYVDPYPAVRSFDETYNRYIQMIWNHGVDKADRTGTGTRSLNGLSMRFNLLKGVPRLLGKYVPAKTVFDELKFFLEGSTSNHRLREINQMHSIQDWSKKDTIWEEWAKENGELGPIYSEQWRNFRGDVHSVRDAGTEFETDGGVNFQRVIDPDAVVYQGFDQIKEIKNLLMNSPDSRRILVSAWNPSQSHKMALPPCHVLFQFWTRPLTFEERRAEMARQYGYVNHDCELTHEYFDSLDIPRRALCCMLYQRSADSALGVPFNILSYSMLTKMMAHQCNMLAAEFVWFGGDCHIYSNHFEGLQEQMSRSIIEEFPHMFFMRKPESIFDYDWKDIAFGPYQPHAPIEFPVAV